MSSTSNTDSSGPDYDRITVQSYENNVKAYIDATVKIVDSHYKTWLDRVLQYVPTNQRILELGSAFGRDADYMEAQGYTVERTDATTGFVDYMNAHGASARVLDAISDDFGGPYGLVFANAVLVHFAPADTVTVAQKAYEALSAGGIFAISLKLGQGSGWETDKIGARRFFQYWDSKQMAELLENIGFVIAETDTAPSSRPGITWLRFIAQKTTDHPAGANR